MKQWKRTVRPYIVFFLLAVLVFLLSRCFCFIRNISDSMSPTIRDGQSVFAVSSSFWHIHRGDIVLAKTSMKMDFPVLKRIVACPGDIVKIENSVIQVNGKIIAEDIGINNKEQFLKMCENEYYLIGDNVRNSFDSRNFGPIRGEDVLYIVLFVK